MKWNRIQQLTFLLMTVFLTNCGKNGDISISNNLTTFISEENILNEDRDERIIENPSGNSLRDAIRVLSSDQRTKGYFKNISLISSSIEQDYYSYTFSAITESKIHDYPGHTTQEVVVDIAQISDNLYYKLSFGANP